MLEALVSGPMFQMTASLVTVTLLLAPGLALASAEATAEADGFQFLSLDQANPLTLVDKANPQARSNILHWQNNSNILLNISSKYFCPKIDN